MKKPMGYSIIEMMIGITIGIVIIGSGGAFYINTLRSNVDDVKQQHFDQTIQVLKGTMVSVIRRAGYSNSVSGLPDVVGWNSGTHYYINGTCALVTYFDTTLATPRQQFFGYKLDTSTGVFYSYQADNKIDCSDAATWEPLNDPNQITFARPSGDSLFKSLTNPKLIQIHFIATSMELNTEGVPVSREILLKVFIRNN